jgi:hypothetical protein
MARRPDLIVPIRDRRTRKRILTLRNFGWAALAGVLVFAGLTIESSMRNPKSDGEYGRLFGKQVSGQAPAVAKAAPDIVREAPVPDQTAADPTLVDAAARAQILEAQPLTPPVPAPVAVPAPVLGTDVSIVGDANGVRLTRTDSAARPKLSGGIFKQ